MNLFDDNLGINHIFSENETRLPAAEQAHRLVYGRYLVSHIHTLDGDIVKTPLPLETREQVRRFRLTIRPERKKDL